VAAYTATTVDQQLRVIALVRTANSVDKKVTWVSFDVLHCEQREFKVRSKSEQETRVAESYEPA